MSDIKFSRVWAMPNADTFSVKPIGEFVKKYLDNSKISIDPFARNKNWATFTNDINPNTSASYHMDARDFLNEINNKGIKCDLGILDAPYSPRQISECYKSIGKKVTQIDTQGSFYSQYKDALAPIMELNSIVLSFCWNTVGMGKKHGFEIIEIMLVSHGTSHNDTICMAEKRIKV